MDGSIVFANIPSRQIGAAVCSSWPEETRFQFQPENILR